MDAGYQFGGINHLQDLQAATRLSARLEAMIMSGSNNRRRPEYDTLVSELVRLRRQLPLLSLAINEEYDDEHRLQMSADLKEIEGAAGRVLAALQFAHSLQSANALIRELQRTRNPSQDMIGLWVTQVAFWLRVLEGHLKFSCQTKQDKKKVGKSLHYLKDWDINLQSRYLGQASRTVSRSRLSLDFLELNSQLESAIDLLQPSHD